MEIFQRLLTLILALALVSQAAITHPLSLNGKEIEIRGYITSFTSPTSFEVEDYRVITDALLQVELENQTPGTSFKLEDLRIGTFVELRGQFNETTGELKATKIKINLKQFRTLNGTTVLDRRPLEMNKLDGDKWRGLVIADGRRLRIEPESLVYFKLNKSEKKESESQAKEKQKLNKDKSQAPGNNTAAPSVPSQPSSGKSSENEKPDDEDETTAAEEAIGAGPLTSLADIGPGVYMTYEGKEQSDGTVLVSKVTFVRNEMDKGERSIWKNLKVKEKPSDFANGKPGEIKIGKAKYRVLPNQEVQDYVKQIGQSLIPAYQRNLRDGDPNKIPFQVVVIIHKGFNSTAYPNGLIIIHDDVFKILQNEAQLAAVIGHEIAHATQEHTFRLMEHNKKRQAAIVIASLVALSMGQGYIGFILNMVAGAMMTGYIRTMENQADRVGLQYMYDAGYDLREAPKVWKLLKKQHREMPNNFFWLSQDANSVRRSFLQVTIRNSFSNVDFVKLKTNEQEFKSMAALAYKSNPKNK